MAEWEVEPIREWRERNPGAECPTFEDAKRIVRELLADVDLSEIQPRGKRIGLSWSSMRVEFGQDRADEALGNWIFASERDFDYWIALRMVAAELLRNHEPLPDALADWLAEVLEGKRTKPGRKPGKSWYAHNSRDIWIGYAVSMLSILGMSPTRNEASPHESACDAVSQVVGERLSQSLSYAAVVSIWRKLRATDIHLPAPWEVWDQKLHSPTRKTPSV